MMSTLLLGNSGMSKEVSYQALEEGENQHSVKQVTCITKSMGPINNGQSNESRGELKVTASNPLVDSLSCVESDDEVEYGAMCEEVATRVCGEDPQSLVRLRTGNSKVELVVQDPRSKFLVNPTRSWP